MFGFIGRGIKTIIRVIIIVFLLGFVSGIVFDVFLDRMEKQNKEKKR